MTSLRATFSHRIVCEFWPLSVYPEQRGAYGTFLRSGSCCGNIAIYLNCVYLLCSVQCGTEALVVKKDLAVKKYFVLNCMCSQ